MTETFDILVIGAGAAGLMCAIEAGRRGRRVLVIDHADKPAEKIRISGGGRCNFTNRDASPKQFLSSNPHFCVSALKRFTAQDFIARVDAKGIAWHEKTLGQLFCDGSAKQIIDMLLEDLSAAGGELRLSVEPGAVRREGDGFVVETSVGAIACASLVIATGGKSIPKMGSSGYAYEIAEAFGLKLVEPRPALVPFTFGSPAIEPIAELAGLSVEARASCGKTGFDEGMLFTHRGLVGAEHSADFLLLARGRRGRDRSRTRAGCVRGIEAAAERPTEIAARQCTGGDRAEAAGGPDRGADVCDIAAGGSVGRKAADGGGCGECVAGDAEWD